MACLLSNKHSNFNNNIYLLCYKFDHQTMLHLYDMNNYHNVVVYQYHSTFDMNILKTEDLKATSGLPGPYDKIR